MKNENFDVSNDWDELQSDIKYSDNFKSENSPPIPAVDRQVDRWRKFF